jgi:hypothetical protein
VSHLQATEDLKTFEDCILHLEISKLDIHQAITLCWTHKLYTGVIFVYNRGCHDYTTPLRELLGVLRTAVKRTIKTPKQRGNAVTRLDDEEVKLGYKIIVYINSCLRGLAYPTGDIPAGRVDKVKWEVYKHILAREGAEPYPLTRTLLQFDTRAFLNALEVAFEDADGAASAASGDQLPSRQNVVDILLEVMVAEAERTGVQTFSAGQAGQLFAFLARQMARGQPGQDQITVRKDMFEKTLAFLTDKNDATQHEERQQALLELLRVGTMQIAPARLLELAERAKFYRVCQVVHEKRGQLHKVISCFLRDPARERDVYQYIRSVLNNPRVAAEERARVQAATLERETVKRLTDVDAGETARLLLLTFNGELSKVVGSLAKWPKVQFKLLSGIVTVREILVDEVDEISVPTQIHERYVELMCQLHPARVFPYLREATDYRVDECLEIVQKHQIMDATAWLLEKTGNVREAVRLVFGTFRERLAGLNVAFVEAEGSDDRSSLNAAYKGLRAILAFAIQMCSRVASRFDANGREALWFPLLDTLLEAQQQMRSQLDTLLDEYMTLVRDLVKHVVSSMMHFVTLPKLLQKIVSTDSQTSVHKSFGEIKDLLFEMLETYTYEKTLLATTQLILGKDIYRSVSQRKKALNKGVRVQATKCCSRRADNEGGAPLFIRNDSRISCNLCRSRPQQQGRRQQQQQQQHDTISMRELEAMQQQQQQRGGADGSGGAGIQQQHLSQFLTKRLFDFYHENTSPRWQQMLDEMDSYIHKEGPPPVPQGGMMARPDFPLRRAIPRAPKEPLDLVHWGVSSASNHLDGGGDGGGAGGVGAGKAGASSGKAGGGHLRKQGNDQR